MDGAEFERENVGLEFRKDHVPELVQQAEAQACYNYIDHVVDNCSPREITPGMMMPHPSASDPDRETTGGRLVDEASAEHISRAGAMPAGYTQTDPVNEPGGTAWMQLGLALD